MDVWRIAVAAWVALPLAAFLVGRWRRGRWLRRFPASTVGRITTATYDLQQLDTAWSEFTRASYEARTNGVSRSGQMDLPGHHEPGEELPLRYHPARPTELVRDLHPGRAGWVVLLVLWLGFSLGIVAFLMAVALICLAAMFIGARRRPAWYRSYELLIAWGLLFGLGTLMTLALVARAGLAAAGFWGQNTLWLLWNHGTNPGAPW